jgi:hypothetical protein
MASFPSSKVHRPSRRKLGRGQVPNIPGVTVAITDATTIATLTFDAPVIVSGRVNLVVTGKTFVSQLQTSPTVLTQTYSATLSGAAYVLAANDPSILSFQGGRCGGASGMFS